MRMMKNNNNETVTVIGIDHGYGNMKTATRCFPSGVARYDKEPIFQNNLLVYNGMYYQIGEEHNQMCRERGLTVAEKGKHFDGSQIEKGEVIAWSKDKYNLFRQQVKDSFVADCAMAVLKALENCISKEKFIEKMKQFGWNVNWTEKRKHITFQNQDGKKVRDSNLSTTVLLLNI